MGTRNRTRSAGLVLACVVAGVVTLMAGCGGAAPLTGGSQPMSASSPSPRATALGAALPRLSLLTVRRSDVFPQNHARFSFPSHVTVRDAAQVRAVAEALLGLPAMPASANPGGPMDLGIVYHLTFFSGGRALPAISLAATGMERVDGLGTVRWVALSPGFWNTFAGALGLAKPGYAALRGSLPGN